MPDTIRNRADLQANIQSGVPGNVTAQDVREVALSTYNRIDEPGLATTAMGRSAYKTADESVSNTTLQNDDELTVTLAASTKYHFRICLFTSSAGAAEGLKLALAGTVGVTSMKAQIAIYDDTTNTLAAFARVSTLNSAIGAGLSAGDNHAIIEGTIETSAAGTFLLSWAQNAGAGAASTTVQRGSTLIVEAF